MNKNNNYFILKVWVYVPEISRKTLYGKINFSWRLQWVPVDSQSVVRKLFNMSDKSQTVLGVNINDSLLYLENWRFKREKQKTALSGQ